MSFGLEGKKPVRLETPPPPEGAAAPADNLAASPPPETLGPAAVVSGSELPDFAKKADDLEAIKKAVDDAASVGGGLWLSYLFVLFYLAVAAGAVTHADLFLENPVKLPFLNIELPLLAFFFLTPILFLIVHAYTLVHLVMLSDKAKRFHQVLHDQISDNKAVPKEIQLRNAAIRAGLRRQLPSNIFVQFLAGPRDVRESPFGWLLYGIAWITLAVAPVLLLLLIQIQFLPFHSLFVTWAQRIVLGTDLALLLWLWRKIMAGRWIYDRQSRWHGVWTGSDVVIAIAAILFSWTVVTFPGEWQEQLLPNLPIFPGSDEPTQQMHTWGPPIHLSIRDWLRRSKWVSLHNFVFNSEIDPFTRRRWLPFSSTLVLPGLNIYESLSIDDPDKAKGRDSYFEREAAISGEQSLILQSCRRSIFRGRSLRAHDSRRPNFKGHPLRTRTSKAPGLPPQNLRVRRLFTRFLLQRWKARTFSTRI